MLTLDNSEETGIVFNYKINGSAATSKGEVQTNGTNVVSTEENVVVTSTHYKFLDIDITKQNITVTNLTGTWNYSHNGANTTLEIQVDKTFTYQTTGANYKITGQLVKEGIGY